MTFLIEIFLNVILKLSELNTACLLFALLLCLICECKGSTSYYIYQAFSLFFFKKSAFCVFFYHLEHFYSTKYTIKNTLYKRKVAPLQYEISSYRITYYAL